MTQAARYHRIVRGSTLSWLETGDRQSPTLLLIHGLGWDAERLWGWHMAPLAQAGWRVVAPDLRGVGDSAPLTSPVGIADFADDLESLCAEIGVTNPVVVGFSMGGMVALELASRSGFPLAGLALSCSGIRSTPAGQAGVEAMLDRARELGPDRFAAEQAQIVFGEDWASRNRSAVSAFRIWRAEMDQPSLHHAFRAPFGTDYTALLPTLDMPVTVIAAEHDRFVSLQSAAEIASAIPGAEFEIIPGSGHMAPVETPAAFRRAILALLTRVENTTLAFEQAAQ